MNIRIIHEGNVPVEFLDPKVFNQRITDVVIPDNQIYWTRENADDELYKWAFKKGFTGIRSITVFYRASDREFFECVTFSRPYPESRYKQ